MRKIIIVFVMMLCAACVASAANYLTFTAEEDSSSFGIVNEGNNPDVQYSLDDGETWIALAEGDTVVLVHKGDKALLKGVNPEGVSRDGQRSTFKMTGKVAASGSLMSLIDGTGLATEIPGYACFDQLFIGCTSLTKAPELSATTLAGGCYSYMFYGCTNLSEIRASFDEWERGSTSWWVKDVAPTGTFICPKELPLEFGFSSIPIGWTVKNIIDGDTVDVPVNYNYLTFTAEEDSSSFRIVNKGDNNPDVQYSLDGGETWTALADSVTVMLAHKGDTALLRGYNPNGFSRALQSYSYFTMTGKMAASGSVMSLLDGMGTKTELPENCSHCFIRLFEGCSSLTQAPTLPATVMKEACYRYMFRLCTNLKQAPELPSTSLATACYGSMFEGCTSLTQIPALPATEMAPSCYSYMFGDCTGLTQIPALPGTTMSKNCYAYMFNRCTGITKVPDLPAESLTSGCYMGMFTACENLSEINVSFRAWVDGTSGWVRNVAPTGTFICPKDLPLEYGTSRIPSGWTVKYIDEGPNYLTLTAEEDGSSFGIVNNGGNNPDLQYSLDGGKTWTALAGGDTVVLAHKGDKALLKGNNPEGFSKYWDQYSCFRMTGKVAANGSVMSLIDGLGLSTEIPGEFCFRHLFSDCTSLTQAPELPATTLTGNCYESMFSGCTSLTQAPALPATTLTEKCYDRMFSGCASLTRAPELPATTLAEACYEGMFQECTSLTQAPALPATTLPTVSNVKGGCYIFMFSGCTSLSRIRVSFDDWNDGLLTLGWVKDVAPTGTFICPKALALEYGMDRIPEGWTVKYIEDEPNYLTFTAEEDGSSFGFVNETNNPDVQYSIDGGTSWIALSGGKMVTLAHKGDKVLLKGDNPYGFSKSRSQYSTFKMTGKVAASGSVMSLIDGTGLSTEIPNGYCFCRLFRNCTSLTQAPELPATSLTIYCYDAMFLGCTNLTQVPALPATTLANFCYDGMFAGCTSLTQPPELPVTTLASGCYYSMFSDCTGLTQALALPATTLADSCYMYMFSGCTGLSEIHVSFDNWLDGNNSTAYWVRNVAPTGTFICPKTLALEYGISWIPEGWRVQYVEDMANYLTFTAEEDGSTFGIVNKGDNNPDVQYSLDGGKTWTALADGDSIVLAKKGDKALLKGNNPKGFSQGSMRYTQFVMSGSISASGSVMSLIDGVGLSVTIPCDYCFHSMFSGCTSLAQAPELPATALAGNCYWSMFSGCTSLVQAPELPATTLAGHCYAYMFKECTSLTQAPELPATTLTEDCYAYMFRGCTSLTRAPELPAMTMAKRCYAFMFSGCTSLTQAPALPATTLADACYCCMFSSCTSLTEAPALPATTLAKACYSGMFQECTSLTRAPELPATTLPTVDVKNGCYSEMFSDCTSLSQIRVSFDDWNDGLHTDSWVADVAPTGTFICPKALALEYGEDRIPEGWTVQYVEDLNYLTFTAEEDGSTFGIVNGRNSPNVLYSLDGGKIWTFLAEGDTVRLAHKGDKALLKGNNPHGFSQNYSEYQSSFKMTGKIAASGSVMSLIDGTGLSSEIRGVECFGSLFENCTSLTQAPELPAVTLANYCYAYMFRGCTSLTRAPELPATTLAEYCYSNMFSDCTSLVQAPELPAATLARGCYSEMFSVCTSLTKAPALIATTLARTCYYEMFRGCTGLSKAPALPATTLADACYSYMFSSCTSLTEAPELPATTLAKNCYYSMFSGCTSLTKAPNLPAPELPAPVNKNFCYGSIFLNCTNLSEISVAFNVWDDNTSWWVKNVAPTGTFICPKALAVEYGVDRIPEGWTVQYAEEGSGVSSSLSDNITVWTDDLTVHVCGAEGVVSLYDVSGKRVAVSNSADEERALSVPAKGAYVVRANGGSSVVLVR